MVGQRLYKIEKLRSEIAIGQLFDRSNPAAQSVMAYPLRAVWTVNLSRLVAMETSSETSRRKVAPCPQFLVSIPKKKLRHAVDRVQMRRRVREAYRLNRHLIPKDIPLDIAFIYVATEVLPYAEVLKGVTRILTRISAALTSATAVPQGTVQAPASSE